MHVLERPDSARLGLALLSVLDDPPDGPLELRGVLRRELAA